MPMLELLSAISLTLNITANNKNDKTHYQGCELYAEWRGAVLALTLRTNRMSL